MPGPGGVTSLREAVCAANTTAGADAITFSVNGTFLLNKAGVDEDASNTGDLDITESLTITGNGQANTIIDGNATERILDTFGSPAITVTIGNVTLRNGRVDGTAFDSAAAVFVDNDDTVTITGSAVTGNTAIASGGAIENRGTLTIANSAFTNKRGQRRGRRHPQHRGALTISNTTFTGNAADFGGALWNSTATGTTAALTAVTFHRQPR